MKKLFTLIAAALVMVACSEDVTTNCSDGNHKQVAFSVSCGDAVTVQIQNTSTRANAPWVAEKMSESDVETQVVAVETDLPTEEPLCLTITEEPFIRRTNTDMTRGALLNSGDADDLSFGVTEYPTGGTNIANVKWANSHPTYEGNISAGEELFKAIQKWESDAYTGTQYDFYAYAPWQDGGSGQGITLSENRQAITYDPTGVPANNQPDLMTALKATSAYVGAIPLNFQHRLCAVQIKTEGAWDTDYEVSGIQFQNIYYYGSFDIDTDKDADWNSYNGGTSGNPGPKGNYTVTGFVSGVNKTNTVVAGPAATELVPDTWLMMIPQILNVAKLSITLKHTTTGNTYTMTAPINNSTWRAGYTVTYTVGPEQITSMSVSYPQESRKWKKSVSEYENGPVTSYNANEEFGLFVVDKDGNIIVSNATAKAHAEGTDPVLDLPTGLFCSKLYKYFLMYPKKTDDQLVTLLGGNIGKLTTSNTAATADAFFSELITAWSPAGDQSDIGKWKAQDLQVAMFDGSGFPMVHKMGLVNISLGTKTVPTTRTYSSGGASGPDPITNMKYTDSDGTQTVTASSEFDDSSKPLNSSGYYYIVNGSKILKSVSTVNTDWERELMGIVAGSYNTITIENTDIKRTCYKFTALFPYTGAVQEFPLPVKGTMTMQCWGASGATMPGATEGSQLKSSVPTNMYDGGKGGYVSGIISSLGHYTKLYVYVGQTGVAGYTTSFSFNGGGYNPEATATSNIHAKSQGGGATDIRLAKHTYGTWGGRINTVSPPDIETDASMSSRLIVAGGGAGAAQYCFYSQTTSDANNHGGDAGGLTGYSGNIAGTPSTYTLISRSTGGTQSSGGYSVYYYGGFGYGGSGYGGGGGGYYGGGSGGSSNSVISSGGGGSSYVSGHGGCTSLSYGGNTYTFSSPEIWDGLGYKWNSSARTATQGFPTTSGSGTENGHSGNGYAKITMTTPYND